MWAGLNGGHNVVILMMQRMLAAEVMMEQKKKPGGGGSVSKAPCEIWANAGGSADVRDRPITEPDRHA